MLFIVKNANYTLKELKLGGETRFVTYFRGRIFL